MIKAVIFDYGGEITPEKGGGWLIYFAKLLNLPLYEARKIWLQAYPGLNTGEISEDIFWQKVEKVFGVKLPENKSNIWIGGLVEEPWPQMLEFAKQLNAKDIKTAILSNTISPKLTDNKLDYAFKNFNPVILSYEFGMAKPNYGFYKLILNRLDLKPSECVFVDNVPEELIPAKELGMKVVLAGYTPEATIDEVKELLNLLPKIS